LRRIIVGGIHVGGDFRRCAIDESVVKSIAASIVSIGLRNPISVLDEIEIDGEACW
jgi:hypothetical protein